MAIWDLYNEPGNGVFGDNTVEDNKQGDRTLPLLKKVFEWAWEVRPSQPLTCAPWNDDDWIKSCRAFSLENSDIISFHTYDNLNIVHECIQSYSRGKHPVFCTEYLARAHGNTFEHILRYFKANNIGAINWGLVKGKTPTYLPWNWNESKSDEPLLYHNDVFNSDGSLLYAHKQYVFDELK